MVFNDWRDLTHQNAYAPQPTKIEIFANLYKNFKPVINRPYTMDIGRKLQECDNSAFIMDWLDDVLEYFDYLYITPELLYQCIAQLDREVYNSDIESFDFPLTSGDIIFLSTSGDYSDDTKDFIYVMVYISELECLSFDDNVGFRSDPLTDILVDYPEYTNISVMRI